MSLRGVAFAWLPREADGLVRDCLAILLTVAVVALPAAAGAGPHTGRGLATAGVMALFAAVIIIAAWRMRRSRILLAALDFMERHARSLLAGWIVFLLAWCGLVLFSNPYRYEVNGGDAAFFTQVLWNMTHGLKPESSLFTLNGVIMPGDDPRYANAFGFVSVFSLHHHWLPMAVLTPLYALFPRPPMNLFAIQLYVFAVGVPGVYWATRGAGGSRRFALAAATGYSALPQVGTQVFFLGYMDVMGLALLPWLFGALVRRRWPLMTLLALLTSLTSLPFAYFVVFFGLMVTLFFEGRVVGMIVMAIGGVVAKADGVIMNSIIEAYSGGAPALSLFKAYVLDRSLASLVEPAKFNAMYIAFLIEGVAFLPLLAVYRDGRLDRRVLGLFFLLGLAFGVMLLRGYGWPFQRNSFFIVPAYFLGILSATSLRPQPASPPPGQGPPAPPSMLFCAAMLPMILFGNPFDGGPVRSSSALRSHYPWGMNVSVLRMPETDAWDRTLRKLRELVPDSASLAWEADPVVAAWLTNRRQSWIIGREPEGVEYYAFVGSRSRADGPVEAARWRDGLARLHGDSTFHVIYDGNPGQPLLVMRNGKSHALPRREDLLGWGVLTRPHVK